ncbi:MAG: hypothetical protein ACPLTR_08385 [Thermacetogeniaceae bacterium]
MRDETGAVCSPLPILAATVAVLLVFYCDHHRDKLLSIGVAVGLAGGIKEKPPQDLHLERNFARDTRMFRLPAKKDPALEERKTVTRKTEQGEEKLVQWQWKGDQRVFVLPLEVLKKMFYSHLSRDVLAAVTTMYLMGKHEGNKVVTSMREICQMLGLCPNQKNYERIEEVLTWLRLFTIYQQNVPMLGEDGKMYWGSRVFGFCDYAEWVKKDDYGNPLPARKQRVEIKLSDIYVKIITLRYGKRSEKNMLCTIPVAALEAARKLPREHRVPVKNMVYYLAGRGGRVVLSPEKIVDIAGYRPRWRNEVNQVVCNLLTSIEEAGIAKINKKENGNFEITLNYSVNSNVIDADFDVEPPSKSESVNEEELPF